jgi:2-polyprenyl-6-methoxyphenol hydroxylase-like FAD-dependent oxidoreductase
MSGQRFDVAIVGGGIGGLCLAQGLKKAGVSVAVYERDESASSRVQGFRIHIDPQGSTALHECLPPHLWKIFEATQGVFSRGFTLVTEELQELLRLHDDGASGERIAVHRSISRNTLRRVLLAGLGESAHFDKRFVRYEEMESGRYRLLFEDGSSGEADVVIGADGVNSRVRQQYLPDAQPVDTGVVGLGGKIALTDGVMALAPHRLLDGPVMVMPPEPCSLFMAIWKRSSGAEQPLRELGVKEVEGDEDYMVLGFGGTPEYFGLPEDLASTGREMKEMMRRVVLEWHPNLRKLVEMVDEDVIYTSRLRTSQPVSAWKTTHMTLLGDAIHSMTPYRGIGANIALKDAALLCSKLVEADRGDKPLLDAIGEYEAAMRVYGFEAVEASLKSMRQAVGAKRNLGFGVAKTAMRVINAGLSMKRRLTPA